MDYEDHWEYLQEAEDEIKHYEEAVDQIRALCQEPRNKDWDFQYAVLIVINELEKKLS
jgi:hypothetical protein